jgi:hypothetical protein
VATSTAVTDAPSLPTTMPMATPTSLFVKLNFIYYYYLFIYLENRDNFVASSAEPSSSLLSYPVVPSLVMPLPSSSTSSPIAPSPWSSSSSLLVPIIIVVVACRAVAHRAVAIVVVVVTSRHRRRRCILPSLS